MNEASEPQHTGQDAGVEADELWWRQQVATLGVPPEMEAFFAFDLDYGDEDDPRTDTPDCSNVSQVMDGLIAKAASAAADAAAATAAQMAAIADALALTAGNEALFLGSADPHRPEATAFARRAAVAEFAVSLRVSENTVSALAATAKLLRCQLPLTWAAFQCGNIPYSKANIIADMAATLVGQVSAQTLADFDAGMLAAADTLTPAKLRHKARGLRERLHPRPAVDRHTAAMRGRSVSVDADLDGMAWFMAHLPAEIAHGAFARIDAAARNLAGLPDEHRTLDQLRADAAGDILTAAGTRNEVRAVVNVTVPVLSLLDGEGSQSNEPPALLNLAPSGAAPRVDPAILEGYGPIDDDTARRLTGNATTLYRLLVDPVDGATITVDPKKYRPPAELKRLVKARFATCSFPGCTRPAERCDLDHTEAFNHGGDTDTRNLAPLCRHHHGIKHKTGWVMKRTEQTSVQWTSPRGRTYDTDPPPF